MAQPSEEVLVPRPGQIHPGPSSGDAGILWYHVLASSGSLGAQSLALFVEELRTRQVEQEYFARFYRSTAFRQAQTSARVRLEQAEIDESIYYEPAVFYRPTQSCKWILKATPGVMPQDSIPLEEQLEAWGLDHPLLSEWTVDPASWLSKTPVHILASALLRRQALPIPDSWYVRARDYPTLTYDIIKTDCAGRIIKLPKSILPPIHVSKDGRVASRFCEDDILEGMCEEPVLMDAFPTLTQSRLSFTPSESRSASSPGASEAPATGSRQPEAGAGSGTAANVPAPASTSTSESMEVNPDASRVSGLGEI